MPWGTFITILIQAAIGLVFAVLLVAIVVATYQTIRYPRRTVQMETPEDPAAMRREIDDLRQRAGFMAQDIENLREVLAAERKRQ